MKRWIPLLLAVCLFTACSAAEPNIVFTGEVLEVYDSGFLVSTSELDGTDQVSVSYDKSLKTLDFTLATGQTVEVTVLRQMRESYPVQATAVKVKLLKDVSAATEPGSSSSVSSVSQAASVKITPAAAKQLMESDSKAIILDVRTQQEYDEGHIKGALLLPDTEVTEKAAELLPGKDTLILIYCRSGRRSALAAETLANLGYTNLRDFGGIIDWPYETVKD